MTSLERELVLQDQLLPGVSRTFALTIPQLPHPLRPAVTNAYLLCRIADTIEDDPALSIADKQDFHRRFVAAVDGNEDAEGLSRDLAQRLSPQTPSEEHRLVEQLTAVTRVSQALPPTQRAAIARCVRVMCAGMPRFQQQTSIRGLPGLKDLERYCYYVAGVVGEMLTELFSDHHPQIRARRDELMRLSVSFGQGLQMTNILKDFWEDRRRETCWLPRSVFAAENVDLARAQQPDQQAAVHRGMQRLIGIAHACLRDALSYVQQLPRSEPGIRRFCLWALGLAVLTLQNIHRRPEFRSGDEVKVSRRGLKISIATINALSRSNLLLGLAFNAAAAGLPLDRNYGVRSSSELLEDA